MYPSGTKLYTKSNNCKMPKPVKLSVEQFENLTKNMDCVSCNAKTLYIQEHSSPTSRPVNHYIYKKFKRRKED